MDGRSAAAWAVDRSALPADDARVSDLPTYEDVEAAAEVIAGKVHRTPTLRNEVLDAVAGVELFLKAESLQRVGAFKARGATCFAAHLAPEARARGLITYSSGNHGQAVALAAKTFEVDAQIAMPEDAPRVKVDAVRRLGATVTFAGFTSEDRRHAALAIQERTGGVIVPPFDDPHIIAGQGTATLELLEDAPDLDAIVVPVGGGGLAAGACLVAERRGVPVITVEPVGCDAMAQSLEAGRRVAVEPGPTLADGLKPVMIGERNFAIARGRVAHALRVDDEAMARALVTALVHGKLWLEPSGAAPLSLALDRRLPDPSWRRVGVILSGGNVEPSLVARLLAEAAPHPVERAAMRQGAPIESF